MTWVTFLPLAGALLVLLCRRDAVARWLALATSLADLALVARYWAAYDATRGGDQFVERAAWFLGGRVQYHLAMDGISLVLVMLTALLGPVVILSTWRAVTQRVPTFLAMYLLLQTAMIGTFLVRDMLLFYVFWEAMLIPMTFIIGIWGGERRIYAAVKFFIFTMVGSVFMLVAILYCFNRAGTMDLAAWLQLDLTAREQMWLFAAFTLAFAIKVPIWPLHTWLPDAHVEAPTAGSVILAGRAPEDGHLRPAAIRHAALPGCRDRRGAGDGRPRGDRHHLRRAGRLGAAGREETGGLFVGEPPRLRRPRPLQPHARAARPAASSRCWRTVCPRARSSSSSA